MTDVRTRDSSWTGGAGLLLRLDRRRLASALRRPSVGAWIGFGLPVLLLGVAAATAGTAAVPDASSIEGGALLGLLMGAPIAFVAYGTLFRAGDQAFIRRLGVPARSILVERALRLLLVAAGLVTLACLAYGAGGAGLGRPLGIAVGGAVAAWGTALAASTSAARAMAFRRPAATWGVLSAGMWDREVAGAAPLVWAPVLPLLAGAVGGGTVAAAPGAPLARLVALVAAALLLARLAAWNFARALPRFAPQALEMSFEPPPATGGELRVGRGLSRLLPRAAAAVWARDALIAGRRFGWATRVVWPVAILAFFALARWGRDPITRGWVAGAAVLVLLVQGAAIIGLGRQERAGRRWIDRAAGISGMARFLGRWSWGWGMSLWLAVPLSLAWSWWANAGAGWPWLLAGGATALVATVASTALAGWR